MTDVRTLLIMLLALAACKGEAPQQSAATSTPPSVAGQPDLYEELSSAALSKWAALYRLRKEVNLDRAAWPSEEPELDFSKDKGNTIIVHHESGRHEDPFKHLTAGAPFKLFHIEDDPYRLAYSAGDFTATQEEKAKYRSARYRRALEHIIRAKYVVFVVGKVVQPEVFFSPSFTPGSLEGVGVLYEIESKKLLGGFTIEARNSDKVTIRTNSGPAQRHDTVLHDFENNAREALWKALKERFPSARLPTIVYLDSKEE